MTFKVIHGGTSNGSLHLEKIKLVKNQIRHIENDLISLKRQINNLGYDEISKLITSAHGNALDILRFLKQKEKDINKKTSLRVINNSSLIESNISNSETNS